MREILFRAKRVDTGEWVQGTYIHTNLGREMICDGTTYLGINRPCMIDIDVNTLCQYTNMTDKNGQKIWENDILVAHLDENYPEDETYEQVIWHESGFCTMEKNSTDFPPLDDFDTQNFAVCGNVFDNKEILERKE